jgi:hypothetical protein
MFGRCYRKLDASDRGSRLLCSLCCSWHFWGSVTSGQILTLNADNSWHATPPSTRIGGEEIFVCYAGSPAGAQLSRGVRFYQDISRNCLGSFWKISPVTIIVMKPHVYAFCYKVLSFCRQHPSLGNVTVTSSFLPCSGLQLDISSLMCLFSRLELTMSSLWMPPRLSVSIFLYQNYQQITNKTRLKPESRNFSDYEYRKFLIGAVGPTHKSCRAKFFCEILNSHDAEDVHVRLMGFNAAWNFS